MSEHSLHGCALYDMWLTPSGRADEVVPAQVDLTNAVLLGRQDFTVRSIDAALGHEKWIVTYAELEVLLPPCVATAAEADPEHVLPPAEMVNAGMHCLAIQLESRQWLSGCLCHAAESCCDSSLITALCTVGSKLSLGFLCLATLELFPCSQQAKSCFVITHCYDCRFDGYQRWPPEHPSQA